MVFQSKYLLFKYFITTRHDEDEVFFFFFHSSTTSFHSVRLVYGGVVPTGGLPGMRMMWHPRRRVCNTILCVSIYSCGWLNVCVLPRSDAGDPGGGGGEGAHKAQKQAARRAGRSGPPMLCESIFSAFIFCCVLSLRFFFALAL